MLSGPSKITRLSCAATMLLGFIPLQVGATGAHQLTAFQDTYVYSGDSGTNYGDAETLVVKTSNSGNFDRESYYAFDLTELTELQSAYFKVAIESSHGSQIQISYSDGDWDENDISWDTKLSDLTALIETPAIKDEYLKFDVLDLLNSFIEQGETRITFVITSNEVTSSTLQLASRESSNADYQPVIQYDSIDNDYPFSFGLEYSWTEYGYFTSHSLDSVSGSLETGNYGGWNDLNLGGTGFYRTQQLNGSWLLVDPEGNAFITMGLNSVNDDGDLTLPDALTDFGINTYGCWSDESLTGMPYTPRWNILSGFKNTTDELKSLYEANLLPVFYPEFETYADEVAQEIADYADDPWVLGHFSDNELLFHYSQLVSSLELDTDNPLYQEADAWLTDKYGDGYSTDDITDEDEEAYQGYVAETYYRIVSEAIKRYDPNHLYLGSRLHAAAKRHPEVIAAAAEYSDLISVNYYGRWELMDEDLAIWEATDKPYFITEYYTKADDSDLGNEDGAGWIVADQATRAAYFENFSLKLLASPSLVGWHWFRFIDKNDANKGVYDLDYQPYEDIQNSMSEIAQMVYPLRSYLMDGSLDFNGAAISDSSESEAEDAENTDEDEASETEASSEDSESSSSGSLSWLMLISSLGLLMQRRKRCA